MENSTSLPGGERSEDSAALLLEKTAFLICIALVASLALPANLLLLHLALCKVRVKDGNRSAGGLDPGDRPVLLVSQSVTHVLLCATSPLDALFLLEGTSWSEVCVAFLGVKSVLVLFSVLAVSLQGLDKAYRVRNLRQPALRVSLRAKAAGLAGAALLSLVPAALELILTEARSLKAGCFVDPVVVDVTEALFFLGCVTSIASFLVVVATLRGHTRRVAASDATATATASVTAADGSRPQRVRVRAGSGTGSRSESSPEGRGGRRLMLKSISEIVEATDTELAAGSATDVTDVVTLPARGEIEPMMTTTRTTTTITSTTTRVNRLPALSTRAGSTLSLDGCRQELVTRWAGYSSGQGACPTPPQGEGPALEMQTLSAGTLAGSPAAAVCTSTLRDWPGDTTPGTAPIAPTAGGGDVFPADPAPPGVKDDAQRVKGCSNNVAKNTAHRLNHVRQRAKVSIQEDKDSYPGVSDGDQEVTVEDGVSEVKDSGLMVKPEIARLSVSAMSLASVASTRSRSSTASNSSATLRRLRTATENAIKRGVAMLAIFLLCYLPLMVILLVLSLDDPVYETALLLEGLTLPISYVHALLNPVVVIRTDPEWRTRAAALFARLACWKREEDK